MRNIHGLELLLNQCSPRFTIENMGQLLLIDLEHCYCNIYGQDDAENAILLAKLDLLPETLSFDRFDKRIDFALAGKIIYCQTPPLRYLIQGKHLAISGRCSMLARVCGVDWYLPASYTGQCGDIARVKQSIAVKALLSGIR